MHYCQVYSTDFWPPHKWNRKSPLQQRCLIWWKWNQTSWQMWQWEMNHGSTNRTLGQKWGALSGRSQALLDWKRHKNQGPKWGWCWYPVLIVRRLCTLTVPQGTATFNCQLYRGVLGCLRDDVHWKRPKKWIPAASWQCPLACHTPFVNFWLRNKLLTSGC